jgi:hypothetical protein
MLSKVIKVFFTTLFFLGTTFSIVAHAQSGSEGGGNTQSPVQVIVQIIAAAIVLRFLHYFDLP